MSHQNPGVPRSWFSLSEDDIEGRRRNVVSSNRHRASSDVAEIKEQSFSKSSGIQDFFERFEADLAQLQSAAVADSTKLGSSFVQGKNNIAAELQQLFEIVQAVRAIDDSAASSDVLNRLMENAAYFSNINEFCRLFNVSIVAAQKEGTAARSYGENKAQRASANQQSTLDQSNANLQQFNLHLATTIVLPYILHRYLWRMRGLLGLSADVDLLEARLEDNDDNYAGREELSKTLCRLEEMRLLFESARKALDKRAVRFNLAVSDNYAAFFSALRGVAVDMRAILPEVIRFYRDPQPLQDHLGVRPGFRPSPSGQTVEAK